MKKAIFYVLILMFLYLCFIVGNILTYDLKNLNEYGKGYLIGKMILLIAFGFLIYKTNPSLSPNSSSCLLLHAWSLSGWTLHGNLNVLNLLSPASAFVHILWKKLPVPLGVDNIIPSPPVDIVCCSDAHNSSAPSTKAA